MRRPGACPPLLPLVTLACALGIGGCGARAELLAADEQDDPAAEGEGDAPPTPDVPPSCWSAPNCIEADVLQGGGPTVFYRETGQVEPTSKVLWLYGSAFGPLEMGVKLFRDAVEGVQPHDYDDGNVFLLMTVVDDGCSYYGDIVLSEVDTESGGVTEGTFDGDLLACELGGRVRGRFRLTSP